MQKDFEVQQSTENGNKILPAFSISVKVTDPVADPVKGFYTYLITGSDDLGQFEIRRRYNDFFYFREALGRKWPGIYIPPIPQKKIAGNKDAQNIEIRKKFFDYFMKRIGKIKHIFTCSATRQFVRNRGIQMEKYYSSLGPPKYHELVGQYKEVYKGLDFEQNTADLKNQIQYFSHFLKKAEKQLQGLRSQIWFHFKSKYKYDKADNTNAALLPDYEKNIYSQYLPEEQKSDANLIFVNNTKVQENVDSLKEVSSLNSFSVCLDNITYEILEVKAMEEALKLRDKYESELKEKQQLLVDKQSQLAKLNSGKTTFKSFFSRGSKSEQIQKFEVDIPEIEKEISLLSDFNYILTIITGRVELPTFKRNKQIQYYRMMYEISENELKYLASYGQLMKSVLQGLNK